MQMIQPSILQGSPLIFYGLWHNMFGTTPWQMLLSHHNHRTSSQPYSLRLAHRHRPIAVFEPDKFDGCGRIRVEGKWRRMRTLGAVGKSGGQGEVGDRRGEIHCRVTDTHICPCPIMHRDAFLVEAKSGHRRFAGWCIAPLNADRTRRGHR